MALLHKMLTEDGVGILSYRIETPDFEDAESYAAAFFEAIAERVRDYLETEAAQILGAEYRACTDARKRFTFRPAVYRMSAVRRGESAVVRRVTLARAGKILFEKETVDELINGRVLPRLLKK